jgi:hypothetical protein
MIIVIDTQDQENYAAHQGFTGEYRWKMKGGSSYKITDVPGNVDPAEIVDLVRHKIEVRNNYFITEIIGWGLEEDGWMSPFETSQLEYEGEIRYREPEIDYSELVAELA